MFLLILIYVSTQLWASLASSWFKDSSDNENTFPSENYKNLWFTEAELTPIVVTQLSNTKKHKDELRKARRGSAPKQADVAAAGERRTNMMTRKYHCHFLQGVTRGRQSPGPRTWSQTRGPSPATRRRGGGQLRPSWRGSCPPSLGQRPRGRPWWAKRESRPRRTSCQRWDRGLMNAGG